MTDLIRRMDAIQACQVGPSDEWARATKDGYNQAATDCQRNILRIEPAPNAGAVIFSPMGTAPKDGTMLCLLVDYSGDGANPLEDATQAWTIGFNNLADTEDDVWQFAGWSWEQDCFTEGHGEVIGWLPLHTIPAVTPPPAQVKPLSGWVIANGQGNRWR